MSNERERLSVALAAMTDQRDYQMDRARKAHLRANNLRSNNQRLLAELEEARAKSLPNDRGPRECRLMADALEAAIHLVDDEQAAETLAKLADQWRQEAGR